MMSNNTLIRQCEAVAQKLYNQCRDTTSPYKTLTSSLRRLRNVLGDIDETLNNTNEPRGNDTKLQPCLVLSKSILEKLDMALVTYRCMSQADVNCETVAGLKTSIEDVTQDLATTHEKQTRIGETAVSTCTCVLTRKVSQGSKTSSSWSIVHREVSTDTNSLESETLAFASADAIRPSNEKEVSKTLGTRLQPSASDTSLGGRSTASWRSMSLDPLSRPIDDATKIILSSDSPTDSKLMDGFALFATSGQDNQRENDEAISSDEGQLWKRVDEVMNGKPQEATLPPPTIVLPDSPGIESEEDLYSATPPPKQKGPTSTEDASLYPDPLQLRKRLVRLDPNVRYLGQAPHLRISRYYSTVSTTHRRNSVGVPAELEGEPVHPPTRSSSCSSLPRYESVVGRPRASGRAPPSRYRRARGRASVPLNAQDTGISHGKAWAVTTGASGFPIEKTPAATKLPPVPTFKDRQSVDEALKLTKYRDTRRRVQYAIRVSDRTWYERDQEDTTATILDQERIRHIVHYWNDSSWDNAELYFNAHLNEINTGSHTSSFRRTQHLLGVCASFKGEWNEAIKRFIEVLHKPINKSSDLDDGDCAAAYWLGDLYAMQNRRADALLAYSVARHSSVFDDNALHSVLASDRIAVRLAVSKNEFKRHWSEEDTSATVKEVAPSILSNDIISMEVVKSCLQGGVQEQRDEDHCDFAELVRARYLHAFLLKDNEKLGVRPELNERMAMKIDANCLDPESPWPMPYDPLFCMANVQRGRLLAYECDMLNIFKNSPDAKLPRPLSLKLDCFTCSDLPWLISTIRTCLTTYEIDHSEVVNVQGTWFCCRYSFMQHKIATTHYFSIALFKHPFRSSFGAEICSDEGMGSARIVETAGNYKNGVHYQEPKRIKRLIRKYLDEAARREQVQGRKASSSGTNASGLPSQYDAT